MWRHHSTANSESNTVLHPCGCPLELALDAKSPTPTSPNATRTYISTAIMPDEPNQAAGDATVTASLLAFKAPPFYAHDPNLWFNIVECNFKSNRITASITKFSHVTALLPQEVLTKVSDVVAKALQSQTPYEDLKTAIVKRLESSISTRLQELLSKEELGNEKPSDLLRRMQRLLQDKYDSFDPVLFRQLYYQRLPTVIQNSFFAVKDKVSLEELAQLADDFMSTVPNQPTISHVAAPTTAPTVDDYKRLTDVVSQLTLQVNSLSQRLETRERSRSRDHFRRRSRSSSRPRKKFFCWYHHMFGEKANRCTEPCDYKSNKTTSENEQGGH